MKTRFKAKKAFGQHFLTDRSVCQRITELAGVRAGDVVIEIGPGTGQLSRKLLDRGARVVAIEIDRDLVPFLRTNFAQELDSGQFTLEQADALTLDWPVLLDGCLAGSTSQERLPSVKLVANLPYNIATRLLTIMTGTAERFHSLTVMVQKEVAARILASSGNRDYGYLTLRLGFYFIPSKGFDVPRGAFFPPPKVTSHVLRLDPRREIPPGVAPAAFQRLIETAFTKRRKTLWNNLAGTCGESARLEASFSAAGIPRLARPEQVSLNQFLVMATMLSCGR